MQHSRDQAIATYQAPADHPDPEAYKLATAVILRAFKALNENDRAEIEDAAQFFSDTRKDSMLSIWLRIQSARDPQGSHRMAVCKRIGEKALHYIGQTHHHMGAVKAQMKEADKKQKEINMEWTATFHRLKDIPELRALAG